MAPKVQIIEANKTAWDLVKYKIESVNPKAFDFLPFYASVEESIGVLVLQQPDILIADLKVLFQYDLDVLQNLLYQSLVATRLIVLAAPNQLEGIQRMVEIGIAALVIKPLNASNLARAMTKVTGLIETDKALKTNEHFITFKTNRSLLYLNQLDILFIESNRNICTITIKDGNLKTINENISSIEQRLMAKELMRVDKSTIINLSKITYLGGDKYTKECKLRLSSGEEISKPLSKIAMSRLHQIVANNFKNQGQGNRNL